MVNVLEALNAIDPSELSYQEWVDVGMALKAEGLPCSAWDEWSRADHRYHPGECERKWESFQGSGVTAGTVVKMAKDRGWSSWKEGRALDWDDVIELDMDDDVKIIDKSWLERPDTKISPNWDPVKDITDYLDALFLPDDYVGYVMQSFDNDGKLVPKNKGAYDRTAGELIQALKRSGGDIGAVLGDYDPKGGAWIRFNPLDGNGVKNANVTDYRFALVESDSLDIGMQEAIIRELELPVAAMVYSGGKSVHAIVHIDAVNDVEYRNRVEYLYSVLRENNFPVDAQNKNPSRLSRMPGIIRGDKKQWLMATNIGKASFDEWNEWFKAKKDSLPDFVGLDEVWGNIPELAPVLIDGVLRQGHKMLIAGPSKAGKSFALIELAIAIAEGREWFGFRCEQGRVLYVNLELDDTSCFHRFEEVYGAMGIAAKNVPNLKIWNLRGENVGMKELVSSLKIKASKGDFIAVIIDPIYKVIEGDENKAGDMALFCNQFDKICKALDCAVIYCHHHSKGAQGGKRAMDRASGSGVFARDPDALLDMLELEPEHKDDIPEESTAWRVSSVLREFKPTKPFEVVFDYPLHKVVNLEGATEKDLDFDTRNKQRKSEKEDRIDKLLDFVYNFKEYGIGKGEHPFISECADFVGVNNDVIYRYIRDDVPDKLEVKKGIVYIK